MDEPAQTSLLSEIGYETLHKFSQLADALSVEASVSDQHLRQTQLEFEYQRFKLWAANLGLHQHGHASLDYLLRDAGLIKEYIADVLKEMNEYLAAMIAIAKGEMPQEVSDKDGGSSSHENQPIVRHEDLYTSSSHTLEGRDLANDIDASVSDSEESMEELPSRMNSISERIDGLYDLGAKIRNSAMEMLARLTNFDTVFIVDDTGSMQLPADSSGESENRKSRWDVLEKCLVHVIGVATCFVEDGVDLYFLKAEHLAQTKIGNVKMILRKLREIRLLLEGDGGGTYFYELLREAIQHRLARYEAYTRNHDLGEPKPLNLIAITDGAADDQDEVEEYLVKVAQKLNELNAPRLLIGVRFVQIGDDEEAAKWLESLGDELSERKGFREMVETVSVGTIFDTMENNDLSYAENWEILMTHMVLAGVMKGVDVPSVSAQNVSVSECSR